MGLIFPTSVPFLEDKGAIMVLIVSSWYSGVTGHLRNKCGLFCRVVYRIVFRETDVTRDSSERDSGANRVEGVNGKVNALHEGVCRIEIREGVKGKERVREEKEFTVGRGMSKAGEVGKDAHEFGCRD